MRKGRSNRPNTNEFGCESIYRIDLKFLIKGVNQLIRSSRIEAGMDDGAGVDYCGVGARPDRYRPTKPSRSYYNC